jgi:hypothetical protein
MGNKRDGYVIHRICPGAPLLLVFGASVARSDAFEDGKLWERIAPHCGRSCSLVLLNDEYDAGYYRGITGLGDSIGESADNLRSMIASFNASEVIACGVALGGHAALVFGALLAASRVVALEPVAHLIANELDCYNDRRWRNILAALPAPSPGQTFNALTVMTRCRFDGDAFVLFGTGRGDAGSQAAHLNLVHAQWLARSERVTLCPFTDVRQDLWGELERRGELEEVVKRYLFEEQSERRPVHKNQEDARTHQAASQAPAATVPSHVASVIRDIAEVDSRKIEVEYAIAGNGDAPELRHVDDEMRRWIAENLLIGEPPANIVDKMRTVGIPECVAFDEIRAATASPYLRGALRVQNRLKKRDWLLSVYSKLGRLHPGLERVDRRHQLSRNDFLVDYYTLNRPVILGGMIDNWPARTRWGLVDFCLTTDHDDNQHMLSSLMDDVGRLPEYLEHSKIAVGAFDLDPIGAITPFRHEYKNVLVALIMGKWRVRIVLSWDLPSMANTWQNLSERDGRRMSPVSPDQCGRPQVLECIVEQGELLFLPVGCWYFIETIEISAAVTFTQFVFDNDFSAPDIVNDVL